MKSPVQAGAPPASRYNIRFHNAQGAEIPAYAVIELDSASNVGADTLYEVKKPTTGASGQYLINSPATVASDAYGFATNQFPTEAAISGSPAVGATVGPTNGSWLLSTTGSGYVYVGGLAAGVGRVIKLSGGKLRFARVTTAFAAATGPLQADWTDGQVKFQDDSTGALDSTATDCKNAWIGTGWVVDAQVAVDMSYTPPRVVNGTCTAVDWGA